jgi:hypothetical protein
MCAQDQLLAEGRKLHNAWFDGPDMEQRDRMIRMALVAREIHKPKPATLPAEHEGLAVAAVRNIKTQYIADETTYRHIIETEWQATP